MDRIAIWYDEHEVGGGLPSEWRYSHSSAGASIGWVVLPQGMRGDRFADYVTLWQVDYEKDRREHVANLSTWRLVEAAVEGEFGLSWSTTREGGA